MSDVAERMSSSRQVIISEARRWIGTPYMHQASLIDVGCDCLGLVRGVWRSVIGPEPEQALPYTPDWAEAGGGEPLVTAARRHFTETSVQHRQPGDVLLFRWRNGSPAKHMGIAASRTTMVHAHDGAVVCEIDIAAFWLKRLSHVFVFPVHERR